MKIARQIEAVSLAVPIPVVRLEYKGRPRPADFSLMRMSSVCLKAAEVDIFNLARPIQLNGFKVCTV